jgi:asparagine synthase (glutamine-hydrolysing)
MDDLVADYAVLPTIKLARRASRDVKVILSGEGGDEVFAGYSRYRRGGLLDSLLGRRFRGHGEATPFAGLFRKELYDWKGGFQVEPLTQPGWTRLQGYQATDIADWLPDDLLTKVDRCLMAFGVEGRVPFLDQAMIEFGFALPDALKLEGKQGKKLLKSWLHARHPQMEVWAKKRGFTVPIAAWLERRRPLLKDYLTSHEGLLEVMERQPLTQLLEKPLEGKGAKLIFTALSYALWHDSHVARRSLEGQRLFAGEAAHAA